MGTDTNENQTSESTKEKRDIAREKVGEMRDTSERKREREQASERD